MKYSYNCFYLKANFSAQSPHKDTHWLTFNRTSTWPVNLWNKWTYCKCLTSPVLWKLEQTLQPPVAKARGLTDLCGQYCSLNEVYGRWSTSSAGINTILCSRDLKLINSRKHCWPSPTQKLTRIGWVHPADEVTSNLQGILVCRASSSKSAKKYIANYFDNNC